jgi:hypothetical protein
VSSTRLVIAAATNSTPSCFGASTGAANFGCGTLATTVTDGAVRVGSGVVSATGLGASIAELDAAVSGSADDAGVSATAVFFDGSAVERAARLDV